jgi:cytochrome P450
MRYTTDVTVSLAFGTDMNSIEEGGQLLQEHLSLVFPAIGRRLNAVFPYWRYFRMPSDRKLDRALRHIRQVQEELLAQARERVGKRAHGDGDGSSHDMLEAMLMARDEDGQPYDDEAIYGNMLTMLLAGEDTTAYAISWALHFLADRPKLMDALCEEVEQRSADSVLSDLNAAAPLPLVDAVAQETLRLKSPAPAAPLGALVDLMVDDVFVPAGTAIQLMTRLPTLDPDRFAAPDEFRPERWLDGGDSTGPHDVRSHIPFGSGPRICPGRSLALLEMRLVLSMLAKNFRLKRVGSPDEVQERTAFVLTPVGIRVMMIPRSDHR